MHSSLQISFNLIRIEITNGQIKEALMHLDMLEKYILSKAITVAQVQEAAKKLRLP